MDLLGTEVARVEPARVSWMGGDTARGRLGAEPGGVLECTRPAPDITGSVSASSDGGERVGRPAHAHAGGPPAGTPGGRWVAELAVSND